MKNITRNGKKDRMRVNGVDSDFVISPFPSPRALIFSNLLQKQLHTIVYFRILLIIIIKKYYHIKIRVLLLTDKKLFYIHK